MVICTMLDTVTISNIMEEIPVLFGITVARSQQLFILLIE
jgi:hypothetical protein